MKTTARETESQIALRNCSKEVGGEVCIYVIWGKGGTCNQAHIFAEGFCSSREGYY